jgi:putative peptidoglycan lipid II flippase
VLSILVKSGTAVRELLVAWYFGLSEPLDAYFISYAVPYFVITLVAGSLPQVFLPAYVRLRNTNTPRAAEELASTVALLASGALVVVALFVALAGPLYLPLVGRGFNPSKLLIAETLLLFLAPTVLTSVLVSLAGAILNAHNRFLAPALSPLLGTAVVIGMLTLFAGSLGIVALALGVLVGTAAELIVLGVLVRRQVAPRLSQPVWSPNVRDLTARFGATLIGAALMAATLLVDQAMSSNLAPGSVAALNYANRLVTVPLGLTAAALGTVALPYFSTLVSQMRWTDVERTARRYLVGAFLVTAPLAALLAVFAPQITDLLLRRGAFTDQDVQAVAPTLAALAAQIPFYTGVILLMRLALALRLNAAIAVISGVNLVLDVVLNAWLSSFMGLAGIALSTSIVYACSFGMLLFVAFRQLRLEMRGQMDQTGHTC